MVTQTSLNNFAELAAGAKRFGITVTRDPKTLNVIVSPPDSVTECAENILSNLPKTAPLYKIAAQWDKAIDALPELPSEGHPSYWNAQRNLCEAGDAAESDFIIAVERHYQDALTDPATKRQPVNHRPRGMKP